MSSIFYLPMTSTYNIDNLNFLIFIGDRWNRQLKDVFRYVFVNFLDLSQVSVRVGRIQDISELLQFFGESNKPNYHRYVPRPVVFTVSGVQIT